MKRLLLTLRILLAAMVVCTMLGGCSAIQHNRQTAMQPNAADDVMEGAGLFSGEDGEIVIYRK